MDRLPLKEASRMFSLVGRVGPLPLHLDDLEKHERKETCSATWQVANPPTPVERVDGSPQLGLPSESLIKAKGFSDCFSWACCAGCPKPVFVQCFWAFHGKNLRFG